MLSNNPAFKLEHTDGPYRLFLPTDTSVGYTTERYMLASHQMQYSEAGITAENLKVVADYLIELANSKGSNDTIRTDVGAIGNRLLYSLKFPVDHECALRMGAILTFIEYEDQTGATVSEDSEKYLPFFTDLKVQLARQRPKLYAFFLRLGIDNTPRYRDFLETLTEPDYFRNRNRTVESFLATLSKPFAMTSPVTLNPASDGQTAISS